MGSWSCACWCDTPAGAVAVRAVACQRTHLTARGDCAQAHMANCKSMLEAFRLGGDFHSRTALGMYPHVRKVRASFLAKSSLLHVSLTRDDAVWYVRAAGCRRGHMPA
jgi:hypothetical protein